ncbi:L-lactate dehydrogenase complex protein LldE [Scopulibacillus daqui]|uniref:Lactate utilization protein A n=1 Tax=Scopulibacillus daqui TaxID=1469162 RepID=A0ABS2Q3T3_9BACL|nr:(Fe-S)-binding protein [Scopulibacillus daqui]MBM7646953.1 L-lactate dehydrogenase complex protein LldE [Scopulibacillus daqui]
MKVSLFITCLADIFYPEVGKDVVEILEDLGCEVDFPKNQTCCGQPAYNSGYHKETKTAAKHMIEAFEGAEYAVAPSGSCVMMVHEFPALFSESEKEWQEKAAALANKTYEFTQFVVEVLGKEDLGAELHRKAAVHTSCHMNRLMGIKEPPQRLLKHVKGLEVVPLSHSYDCCGFGGTFSVKMPEISEEMVEEKTKHMMESDADLLIGMDCSCLMNIKGRLTRKGCSIEVKHIAQVLNEGRK